MTTILPNTTTVLEAAHQAQRANLHLITDGKRTVLSPIVMPGWYKLGVNLKPSPPAENQCSEAA